MKEFVKVAEVESVTPDDGIIVKVKGREIAVFRLEDGFFAVDNVCPHLGGPIGEGIVRRDLVTCPWHDWSFSIKTGICTINPAAQLETFPVKVEDGQILIEI